MTHHPLTCPVCGRFMVEPLLEDFRITAKVKGLSRNVNAMKAFRCQGEGHIFFIRVSDLQGVEPSNTPASTPLNPKFQ